jgi:hypothetical protein
MEINFAGFQRDLLTFLAVDSKSPTPFFALPAFILVEFLKKVLVD